ncbi:glutathione-dependent formaldehyde-activating protein [Idiomarina xiamenensis]|uniref:Glutathione-dependent formaldehyde-activating protein n=1 Tax=Idiomarina xiamenensis 10-D-4 TaxID=740709 RepID=K2KY85_9GAMM|nr:glutathione-dependent formaldehyde-activating protein [Idiomarina xiamenensis]EKE87534.1 glutathione-dependent formaldehyde-activating protein [Idiomarina xiamenensis 10-D-4]
MNTLTTTCHCGSVRLSLTLPKPAERYHPRRCDCDFCTQRGLVYLSDAKGNMLIQSKLPLHRQRQGSHLADFLSCPQCDTTLATAFITPAGNCVGAANATLFPDDSFADPIDISPKQLSAAEKAERWARLWTPLRVVEGNHRN